MTDTATSGITLPYSTTEECRRHINAGSDMATRETPRMWVVANVLDAIAAQCILEDALACDAITVDQMCDAMREGVAGGWHCDNWKQAGRLYGCAIPCRA